MAAALAQPETIRNAMRCGLEGTRGVAVFYRVPRDEIVRATQARLGRILAETVGWIEHGRQRLVIKLHQRRGIFGDGARVRYDDGNRFADIADFIARQRRRIDVEADRLCRQRQRNAVVLQQRTQIVVSQHRVHAGQRPRGGQIDAVEPGVGNRAADECSRQRALGPDVVEKSSGAADEAPVLNAQDGLTEARGKLFARHARSSLNVQTRLHLVLTRLPRQGWFLP